MRLTGYADLQYVVPTFLQSASHKDSRQTKMLVASFKFDRDVSALFPYINAVCDDAVFYDQPAHVRLLLDGHRCLLYPHMAVAYYFENKGEAENFAGRTVDFLNRIDDRKAGITPNHDQLKRIPIMDMMKVLPKTNCRECGYTTCMAFAAALMKGKAATEHCPSLARPIHENAVYPVFDDQGRIKTTLSLRISTSDLKQTIKAQQNKILMLEASLKSYQQYDNVSGRSAPVRSTDFGLTAREVEVLKLIAEGYTNNEISGMLFISAHTVKSHMINIFNKLNVNDRTKAAVMATREKLI